MLEKRLLSCTSAMKSFSRLLCKHIESASRRKALSVAVIGAPNVGKSLLTNQLVKAAVSAVSSKMDTTTKTNEAIITEDNIQMIVLDSPGTIGVKHARDVMGRAKSDRILSDPESAIEQAQHILVVQDATAVGDYIHHRVMHLLHRHAHVSSSLVINKTDLVKNRSDLLELTRILTNGQVGGKPITTTATTIGKLGVASKVPLHSSDIKTTDEAWMAQYRKLLAKPIQQCGFADTKKLFTDLRGWGNFESVFFTSSVTGEGVEPLREYLKSLAEQRDWRMHPNAVTTTAPQTICAESVRAALLDLLPGDVAYALRPAINEWRQEGEVLQIVAVVPCRSERIAKLVIGKGILTWHCDFLLGGTRIAEIGRRVNDHMASLFQRQLFVRILVTHRNKIAVFTK